MPENRPETGGKSPVPNAERGQFRPGQSGNPGGRPKLALEFRTRCREFMDEEGWNLLVRLATTEGREQIHALRFIAEQGYGRAVQSVESVGERSLRIILDP